MLLILSNSVVGAFCNVVQQLVIGWWLVNCYAPIIS